MEPRTLQQVARDCGGSIPSGVGHQLVRKVSTDTRCVETGDLFVALKGERFDGHNYLTEAADRGAAAAVVDRAVTEFSNRCPTIQVEDTRVALGQLASAYRQEFDPWVIAVGGSNGKTTAKELIASVLKQRFNTLWSQASYNNDIGVPMTLLRLEPQHEAAVFEVGTNHPGELEPLTRMVQPGIGVITSVGREHLEYFGDMRGVCQEEGTLAESLPSDGTLYFGADNEWGGEILRRTQATVVRVGFTDDANWQVTHVSLSTKGTSFVVECSSPAHEGGYHVGLIGRHQALNATFAIAIGSQLGLSKDAIQAGLDEVKSVPMRMELRTCGGIAVLDDSYNANADSMEAALQTLADLPCKGARVAVLGDMAELGDHAQAAHAEVGRRAAELDIDQLLLVGGMASVTAKAARNAGLHRTLEFETVTPLTEALRKVIHPGDLILIKASRRMRLEQVANNLCEHEALDAR